MTAFNELYRVLLKAAVEGKTQQEVEEEYPDSMDAYQLDCLLHPEKHAPILNFGDCTCCEEESSCISGCIFNAIRKMRRVKFLLTAVSAPAAWHALRPARAASSPQAGTPFRFYMLLGMQRALSMR